MQQQVLTIDFILYRSTWMEDTKCMNKLFKLNNTVFLLIKKTKDLERNMVADLVAI